MRMKIAFFGFDKGEQEVYERELGGLDVVYFNEKLDVVSAEKAKDAEIISGFVSDAVSKEIINVFPNLKLISTRSTGYDHIDCAYAKSKGIAVVNVPGYGAHTVAEFAFGLLLAVARRIVQANNKVRGGDFNYDDSMDGFELCGKTLGVVGTGKIGRNVIKIAKGFGMNIVACDLHPDESFANQEGFQYKELDDVLRESDVVTLHAPATKDDLHLLNREKIGLMKTGAVLINTARGSLVDGEALYDALASGALGGAGLDVLENEADLKQHGIQKISDINRKLFTMPNVVITPHIGFYTREAVANIWKTTVSNIKAFIAGKPENLVQ